MYLNNIFIENMGAIEKFSLLEENIFLANKNPKPIIFLGQNGSGKTTLLSSIVDALYELSNSCFDDVLPKSGMGYKYFKVSGMKNTKIGKDTSLAYIRFCNNDNYFEYIDKQGELTEKTLSEKTNNIISDVLKSSSKGKSINHNGKETDFENDFVSNSYCYFPSDRYEIPYWMNHDVGYSKEKFREQERFSKNLNREILVRKNLIEIKDWILNVFLDSRTNIILNEDGSAHTSNPIGEIVLLQRSITNIEKLLSKILQKDIKINLNYRGYGSSRIQIIDANTNETYIPSLDNLSAGQSTLLSIFGTIIQYSDNYDINKSIQLDSIEGMVVIDEIDLHLHIELQYNVLPELIKLFPKIQFIITTHSPFFVSGLFNTFSNNDVLLINMPDGNILSDIHNFGEFKKAYDLFIEMNKNYKDELNLLKEKILLSEKPLIITEGKTDWKHLKAALQNLKEYYPLLDVEFFEYEDSPQMGSSALKTMAESLKNLPNNRKIICIFDRDEDNIVRVYGEEKYQKLGNNVYAFCIPKIDKHLDKISIEYYYSESDRSKKDQNNRRLFSGLDFYKGTPNSVCGCYQTKKQDKSGNLVIIDTSVYSIDDKKMENSLALSKSDFANNILNKIGDFKDVSFNNFNLILDIINEIVSNK